MCRFVLGQLLISVPPRAQVQPTARIGPAGGTTASTAVRFQAELPVSSAPSDEPGVLQLQTRCETVRYRQGSKAVTVIGQLQDDSAAHSRASAGIRVNSIL